MCGIAGIVYKNNSTDFDNFKKAFALMKHRGPDNSDCYINKNVGLFHHRLSIIDLSTTSNQPYSNDYQGGVLTYNGEIYNYKELAQKYNISDRSDTALLHSLLNVQGEKAIKDLNGIFSFAYLNSDKSEIIIARDRLGVKPLYYINNNNFFAFSSEAKVLYAYMKELELNFQALNEFLTFGSTIGITTFVNGVKKITPGHILKFDLENYRVIESSYWSVTQDIKSKSNRKVPSLVNAKVKIRELLEKGIRRQCMSDVPVGAYLSGGIDSSVVVALASKFTSNRLLTFSAEFEGSDNSELPLARLIAKKYNTEHHEFTISTKGIEEEINDLIYQYDDPFADPAFIPLHLIAKDCKSKAKVVLQGDGGDELFGGYSRHLDASQLIMRRIGYYVASKMHPDSERRKSFSKRSGALNAKNDWQRIAYSVPGINNEEPIKVISKPYRDYFDGTDPFKEYKRVVNELEDLDPLQQTLYTDMQVILPNTFMEKVDKISMYHGIEARVPLLDNELIDYVMRLPGKYKIQKGLTKSLFREVVADLLPSQVLEERKNSFGTPIGTWIRTILYDYIKKTFESSTALTNSLVDTDYLLRKLEEHKAGIVDNGAILWRSAILITWLEQYVDKIKLKYNE